MTPVPAKVSSAKESGQVPVRGSGEGGVSGRAYKKLYIPVHLILAQHSVNSPFTGVN